MPAGKTTKAGVGRPGLCSVTHDAVLAMKARLEAQTEEALMRQFGISYNTWCKIRSGAPIRRSVAERLEARISNL